MLAAADLIGLRGGDLLGASLAFEIEPLRGRARVEQRGISVLSASGFPERRRGEL